MMLAVDVAIVTFVVLFYFFILLLLLLLILSQWRSFLPELLFHVTRTPAWRRKPGGGCTSSDPYSGYFCYLFLSGLSIVYCECYRSKKVFSTTFWQQLFYKWFLKVSLNGNSTIAKVEEHHALALKRT